ncbi:protein vav-like isoform X2 [Tigriopus californicus]|uniref:protein vav-like isoform X2 n=1 Tax=Tigriopus californicus TaxID=6832 RepID=UPI0027DA706A|nr:protein vav-like isoform X2 [Tigriopus californicus]
MWSQETNIHANKVIDSSRTKFEELRLEAEKDVWTHLRPDRVLDWNHHAVKRQIRSQKVENLFKMAELWKQCADWLCRLDVLPKNHMITWPDAKIKQLAFTLRDGVLLCHIAKKLDETSIDIRNANLRPQMAQFLCLKNIRLFLISCGSSFGLKETDLFQPQMLYDYSDFARVLHTLSKLSNCPKAKALGIPGFPQQYKEPSKDEEQIYRTLEDMVNENQYKDFYFSTYGANQAYGRTNQHYFSEGKEEEDIYEDLCYFRNTDAQAPLQKELKDFQPVERRDHCIKELVETEQNYVNALNMLRKHFIKDMKSMKDSDKKTVFMNIKELGEIHAAFYQDLLESVTQKSRKKIGEIFIEFKERFLKYGTYCSELNAAMDLLDTLLNKDVNVRDEILKCERNANEGKFRLRDLLTVPMQRILKYHLLMRELLSNTPNTHEEYHTIKQAHEAMLDVSDYLNEVKRDSEQLVIIKAIQNSITDWNMPEGMELKNYGRLVRDGDLKVQNHEANGKTRPRFVFVFDRMILMCKATRGDHYTFKDSLNLSEYIVQQDNPSKRMSRDSRWVHSFILAHKDHVTAFTMFAKSEEEKNLWVKALKEAYNKTNPSHMYPSTHLPIMESFDPPTSCSYCHKLLKGLFFQGYRCKNCQKPMHKECITLLTKCGHSQPPSLPPRPPSLLLPQPLANMTHSLDERSMSLRRQSSLISVVSLPPPAIPPPVLITNGSNPDYINTTVNDHPWFVGAMGREEANNCLNPYPTGSFLARIRRQNGETAGYAMSLKTHDDVKHMKIFTSLDSKGRASYQYYLADTRKFGSIVELVTYYSINSLSECFIGLDSVLRFPVGELSIATALFDFEPDPKERNQLRMKTGDRVTIIDKYGDSQGWWKACDNVTVGFIPKDYVEEVSGEDHRANGKENEFHSESVNESSLDAGATPPPAVEAMLE